MQKLKELTKTIQEAVHETKKEKCKYCMGEGKIHHYEFDFDYFCDECLGKGYLEIEKDLTLEDVLFALQLYGEYDYVDVNGEFGEFIEERFEGSGYFWRFHKPLHLQSEQLINYLHSILCQKKNLVKNGMFQKKR